MERKLVREKMPCRKVPFPPLSGHRSMTLDRDPQHSSPLTGSFSSHYTTLESENLQTERTLAVIWSNHRGGRYCPCAPISRLGILRLNDIYCSVSAQSPGTRPQSHSLKYLHNWLHTLASPPRWVSRGPAEGKARVRVPGVWESRARVPDTNRCREPFPSSAPGQRDTSALHFQTYPS